MKPSRQNLITFAVVLGIASMAAALSGPVSTRLSGISLDLLFLSRSFISQEEQGPVKSEDFALVIIDEETYRTPPFEQSPLVMWTPAIAAVMGDIQKAGPKMIGMDLIFPTSVEALSPKYDRPLLKVLRRGRNKKNLVIGKFDHSTKPLTPSKGHAFAIGPGKNVHAINFPPDPDSIIRRDKSHFDRTDGSKQTSLRFEMAQRLNPDLELTNRPVYLNFDKHSLKAETWSLADLFACHNEEKQEAFKEAFADKIVMFGVALDVEDRKLSSARWMAARGLETNLKRCTLPVRSGLSWHKEKLSTIPGVFLNIQGVKDWLNGSHITPLTLWNLALIAFASAAIVALFSIGTSLTRGLIGFSFVMLLWIVAAVILLNFYILLPLLTGLAMTSLAFAASQLYRLFVAERERNQIRSAFSRYMSGPLLEQMIGSGKMPELGGEKRDVTIFFSDIAGFTTLSEQSSDEETIYRLNSYFNAMSECVQRHGGIVDKFIGDSVMAIFGAPFDQPDHAVKAVLAAKDCMAMLKIHEMGEIFPTRIGLASGTAIVGNVGSDQRFDYTAIGNVVNTASRLESSNKQTGTQLLVHARTALIYNETASEDDKLVKAGELQLRGQEAVTEVYTAPSFKH